MQKTIRRDEVYISILYILHSQPVGDFYDQLRSLVSSYKIHILLGDFNIEYFVANDVLDEVLSNYTMVVSEPTHIDGSLLDHVYVRNGLIRDFDVASLVKCVFFSDHDAVKIKISNFLSCL